MKQIVILLFVAISSTGYTQSYKSIDAYAKSVKFSKDYKGAAQELTKPYQLEEEKARAIFIWLAYNVRYDNAQMRRNINRAPQRIKASSPSEIEQMKKDRVTDAIERVVKKKKGVCQDFAWIFEAMLEEVGIECEFVSGYSRTNPELMGRIPEAPGHAWSAAKINGEWALFDVTWSTDIFEKGGEGFFMMPPAEFLKSHYPSEEKWQLLDTPITLKEWSKQLFWHKSYMRFPVSNLTVNGEPHTNMEVPYEGVMSLTLEGDYELYAIKKNSDKRTQLSKSGNTYTIDFQKSRFRGHTLICLRDGQKVIPLMEFKVR